MSLHEQHEPSSRQRQFVVRLARAEDVDAFTALVVDADGVLERHPESVEASRATIERSCRSLAGRATDAERGYLLLLEDTSSGEIAGCVGLACHIGLDQPFYDYRVGKIVHSSRPLKSYRCLDVLYLCNDLTGCSEAHSLYVRRDLRGLGGAALLLKAAQMFVRTRIDEFAPRLIAELRGVQDEAGASPFWESVGRQFFRIDQRGAERLVAKGHKAFIAELMPKHPMYVSLLPEAAQAVVGKVHRSSEALAAEMEADGFHFENHVDIFDAGRVLEAHVAALRGVTESVALKAVEVAETGGAAAWWVAGGEGAGFRVARCGATREGDSLHLDAASLRRIEVNSGDAVLALAAG